MIIKFISRNAKYVLMIDVSLSASRCCNNLKAKIFFSDKEYNLVTINRQKHKTPFTFIEENFKNVRYFD
jgi:hypothetical protein